MAERHTVPRDVGWVVTEGAEPRVALARLPDGPPVALHGSSALIWLAVVEVGSTDDVVRRVAQETGEAEATVSGGVTAFLDDLVGRGLLVAER